MADQELKACPFCGSEDVFQNIGKNGDGSDWPYIQCEKCSSTAEPEVWNTRAEPVGVPTVQAGDVSDELPMNKADVYQTLRAMFEASDRITEKCLNHSIDQIIESGLGYGIAHAFWRERKLVEQYRAAPSQPVAGQAKALTDEQIIDLADDFKSTYRHAGIDFPEFDYMGFAHALLDSRPSATPYAYAVRGLILNEKPFLVFEKEIADGFSEANGRHEGTKAYEVFPVYRNGLSAQADVAAVRDAALEEAALECEKVDTDYHPHATDKYACWSNRGSGCAGAIRALKSAAPTAQPQADAGKDSEVQS